MLPTSSRGRTHLADAAVFDRLQQRAGDVQLVTVPREERERDRPAEPIADDVGLGAEAALGAAEGLDLE